MFQPLQGHLDLTTQTGPVLFDWLPKYTEPTANNKLMVEDTSQKTN
jgi:hypothetical protein